MKNIIENLDELAKDDTFKDLVLKVLRDFLSHRKITSLANVKPTDKCIVLHNAKHDFIVGYLEDDTDEIQYTLIPIEWVKP